MQKSSLSRNAVMALLQVVFSGIVIFAVYRHLIDVLGPSKIGIWSLVIASTSMSSIANLGLSGGVVRFVAKYAAHDDNNATSVVIQTTLLSVAVTIGGILAVLYPFIQYGLVYFVDVSSLDAVRSLLPLAFTSVWLSNIAMVINGSLDGFQCIHLRSKLNMAGVLLYATLIMILVNRQDLFGLAYAQIAQYIFIIVCGYIMLSRYTTLPFLRWRWKKDIFSEMFQYGMNFQVISIVSMFQGPITRALLSKFGGLEVVGYYELADRLIRQLRGIFVSASTALVPTIADLSETSPERIVDIYRKYVQLMFTFAILFYTFIFVLTSIILQLWIGQSIVFLNTTLSILSIAWLVNSLASPAYYGALGSGSLKWPVLTNVLTAIINLSCGWFLGTLFGGIGIVFAWAIALVVSAIVLIVMYHSELQINYTIFFSKPNLSLLAVSLAIIITFKIVEFDSYWISLSPIPRGIIISVITCVSFVLVLWNHPVRLIFAKIISRRKILSN